MTHPSSSASSIHVPSLVDLGRKALIQAALAIEQEDAMGAERWLKVAKSAGIELGGAGLAETKGETIADRRASRDRLMAVLTRRFERINLQMQEETDGVPQLKLVVRSFEG